MVSVKIDTSTCIKCGKCARVCPAEIFSQQQAGADIGLQNIAHCIVCGHCVAACPTSSVIHSVFPPEKVHDINRSILPSPEAVMLLCRARRSNRAFTKAPVPAEYLDMILEAAHRAPTASNSQDIGFTLITSPENLDGVVRYTLDKFSSLKNTLSNPFVKPFVRMFAPAIYGMLGRFDTMLDDYARGGDPIMRGAKALILIHTLKGSRFGRDDANLALQNGSLMAESLGVSQFYTGFVCTAARRDKKRGLEKMFGIEGEIQAGLALGMPEFKFPKYIDKKDIEVRRF